MPSVPGPTGGMQALMDGRGKELLFSASQRSDLEVRTFNFCCGLSLVAVTGAGAALSSARLLWGWVPNVHRELDFLWGATYSLACQGVTNAWCASHFFYQEPSILGLSRQKPLRQRSADDRKLCWFCSLCVRPSPIVGYVEHAGMC